MVIGLTGYAAAQSSPPAPTAWTSTSTPPPETCSTTTLSHVSCATATSCTTSCTTTSGFDPQCTPVSGASTKCTTSTGENTSINIVTSASVSCTTQSAGWGKQRRQGPPQSDWGTPTTSCTTIPYSISSVVKIPYTTSACQTDPWTTSDCWSVAWTSSTCVTDPVTTSSCTTQVTTTSSCSSMTTTSGWAAPASVSAAPASASTPACWSACFAQAGIAAESDLCGNTEVDACIHDTCTPAEDKAYWTWYESYCSSSSSVPPPASTTPPPQPASVSSTIVNPCTEFADGQPQCPTGTGSVQPASNTTTGYAWPTQSVAPATGGAGRVVAGAVTCAVGLFGLMLL